MGNVAKHLFPVFDSLIIAFSNLFLLAYVAENPIVLSVYVISILLVTMCMFYLKRFYKSESFGIKDFYKLFESIAVAIVLVSIAMLVLGRANPLFYAIIVIGGVSSLLFITLTRFVYKIFTKFFARPKNVLIVGAGQDGKLIAQEIQSRPNLGLRVVGFLDDNMNNIEDEDSTIPILGLTCDSEAVIKDNNVKIVIVAVKSRMDSEILTDLVRGIPLGVKVWRMYRFYEKITHKFLVSKMSVNWLFYDCVRKKALLYAYLKRICDIIASLFILIITSPISLIAAIGIELSDMGPVFFTQTRIGKFGKPFKMIKFRSMYQDKVEDDFDEDVTVVQANDKRIMPFCRFLRKFKIDEIPQMLNVLRGDMSIVGPRPVREEVYDENREKVPFWECRNWVRPGWCGWQQVSVNEPHAEERLGYDLYYIKHRNTLWEMALFIRYCAKVFLGKSRN